MEINSTIHKNPTDMHIHPCAYIRSSPFPRTLALLWYNSSCPFTLRCSSLSALPFCSREPKKLFAHPSYLIHSLKTSCLQACAYCVGTLPKRANKWQIKWKHGKEFQACIILARSSARNVLRRGLPSKQAGLGIQLQNNYRCKENTFPLRTKLDDTPQSSAG